MYLYLEIFSLGFWLLSGKLVTYKRNEVVTSLLKRSFEMAVQLKRDVFWTNPLSLPGVFLVSLCYIYSTVLGHYLFRKTNQNTKRTCGAARFFLMHWDSFHGKVPKFCHHEYILVFIYEEYLSLIRDKYLEALDLECTSVVFPAKLEQYYFLSSILCLSYVKNTNKTYIHLQWDYRFKLLYLNTCIGT